MRSSFWARPWFLWMMSVALPLAIIPAVLVQEAIIQGELDLGGGSAEVGGDVPVTGSEIALLVGWFVVPLLYAALHLWRYRGGATMLPLFGRGWVSALLSTLSLVLTAVMLLTAALGYDLPEPEGWPFAIWMAAAALYCQALRAAAVRRSLPEPTPSHDELTRVFE